MRRSTTCSCLCLWLFHACCLIICVTLGRVALAEDAPKTESTVLDHLWIWTHAPGVHDGINLGDGRVGKSRMTPVEGARYLGVNNAYFIHFPDNPPASQFRNYATEFRSLRQVVWSLTGAGGDTSAEGRETVLKLAQEFPNIHGYVLDDFLHWSIESAPDPWLAENNVSFPVSLVLTPPGPVTVDRISLVQSNWHSGDYRSKECVLDVREASGEWSEVARGTLESQPNAVLEWKFPSQVVSELRVRILSTHDTEAARSCGLSAVHLWHANQLLALDAWHASATSIYSDRFAAEHVLDADRSRPEAVESHATQPVPASLTPDQLRELHAQVSASGRALPITCVIYTHQISPRIVPHLNEVDQIALWTWRSADLVHLEQNFARLRSIAPTKPVVLGCYMFDYGDNKPMTVERMQGQCELGLKWLREGKIEGLIFLASNICDMDLPAVEWTRQWMADVGGQKIGF